MIAILLGLVGGPLARRIVGGLWGSWVHRPVLYWLSTLLALPFLALPAALSSSWRNAAMVAAGAALILISNRVVGHALPWQSSAHGAMLMGRPASWKAPVSLAAWAEAAFDVVFHGLFTIAAAACLFEVVGLPVWPLGLAGLAIVPAYEAAYRLKVNFPPLGCLWDLDKGLADAAPMAELLWGAALGAALGGVVS